MTWTTSLAAPLAPVAIRWGTRWVASRRDHHRPRASPLDPAERDELTPHFPSGVLGAVRVRRVESIEPPRTLAALGRLGVDAPLAGGTIRGIAFDDTIVVLDRLPAAAATSLLFHELIHVVQYRLLGVRGFVERYVRGWLESEGSYRDIPLERDAYELQRRHAEEPGRPIRVLEAVVARLDRSVFERWPS